jgi:hypothetical protein
MKKLLKNIFLTAILLPFFLISCNNFKHSKEISKIDSLLTVLDSAKAKLHELDTIYVKNCYDKYLDNLKQIREKFKGKKDELTFRTMEQYGLINKPLRNFLRNFDNFNKEINYSKAQLKNLKCDIKNNKIDKEKIAEYIDTESKAVNTLNKKINISVNSSKKYIKKFEKLNPKIYKIIKDLKTQITKKDTKS